MSPSAGCRLIQLLDQDTAFPALVMYPSHAPERPERIGPYTLQVAMNEPIANGLFPLVVISHGSGGSHLVYRNLAEHLARNGFVVAMPEHPGNNRNDNTLQGTAANLVNRPRHVKVTIDWAYQELGAFLVPGRMAIIGHSMGGYTALALAGGRPTAFAHESPDGQARAIDAVTDERVKALVLLAPAAAWHMAAGALSEVHVPILMLTAEKDPHTPPAHAEIIKRGLADPALITHRTIANAGHFSFLSPFPEAMTNPGFAPSQDPPGFDRLQFHTEMHQVILEFLHRTTAAGG